MSTLKKEITLNKTKDKIREVVCNRCDNTTNHLVCSSAEYSWDHDGDIQGYNTYEIIRCSGCDSISFRHESSNSEDYYRDDDGNEIYNKTEEIYPSRLMGRSMLEGRFLLPTKVRTIYDETHAALCSKLAILAGVGIRALVEAVCSEESAKGRTLE